MKRSQNGKVLPAQIGGEPHSDLLYRLGGLSHTPVSSECRL
jgi:hypothetical protein